MAFIWLSERTADISLYSINQLVFAMETWRAFWKAGTGVRNNVFMSFVVQRNKWLHEISFLFSTQNYYP